MRRVYSLHDGICSTGYARQTTYVRMSVSLRHDAFTPRAPHPGTYSRAYSYCSRAKLR